MELRDYQKATIRTAQALASFARIATEAELELAERQLARKIALEQGFVGLSIGPEPR